MSKQIQGEPQKARPVLPIITCKEIISGLERLGYEARCIAAGKNGKRMWAVHRPDPSTGTHYQPRSYFTGEELFALSSLTTKQELRDAIAAAHHATSKNKYIKIRGEENMKKKNGTKKTTAAAEKAARESRSTRKATTTKVATAGKKDAAQAPATKATKKAAANKNGNGKITIKSNDPDVILLASFQDKTTTERMTANNMVSLFKRINAASYDHPVVNKDLNLYDKRQARELARLGIVAKDRIPDVGLAYFAAGK
jgi:hypothetical protein